MATSLGSPLNLKAWVEEHRHLLKPPVGNALVWSDTAFMVMVVGGPNRRKDFHVNPTEEFFYQLEGDITLKVMQEKRVQEIPIREGEIFLLPPLVPHSPQRPANTVGLVLEHKRPPGEHDHVRWYCEQCGEILHDADFYLTNLATQIKPVIEQFYGDESLRTCRHCSTVMAVPPAAG